MPTRTRPSTTTVVEVPEEEAQRPMPGLQFNEPLSWKAGKAIPVADLLRRLQTLSKELRDIEQEEEEKASFTKVAKELASPNLLAHRDKGVKAWTACCLVDILRICAPDAPYTVHQLRVGRGIGREVEMIVRADRLTGYLYYAYNLHTSRFVRSCECVQYSAHACSTVFGASQEYRPRN